MMDRMTDATDSGDLAHGAESPRPTILVVEDEFSLAQDLVRALREKHCAVLGPAPSVAQAFAALAERGCRPDAAILDVRLRSEDSYSIADKLMDLGVPFVFATGFGSGTIPERFSDVPVIEKPVKTDEVVRRTLERARRAPRRPTRRNLTEAAVHAITEQIVTGAIQPGERLLEVTLSRRLGLSRIPLREALRQLHAHGLLVGGGYSGFRSISLDGPRRRQVIELAVKVGAVLIRDAIALPPEQPGCWPSLAFALAQLEHCAATGDRRGASRAEVDLFAALKAASANPGAATLWECLAPQLEILRYQGVYRDGSLPAAADTLKDFCARLRSMNGRADLSALETMLSAVFSEASPRPQ
jgi:DNA-binding GntR family transcriptional regulator